MKLNRQFLRDVIQKMTSRQLTVAKNCGKVVPCKQAVVMLDNARLHTAKKSRVCIDNAKGEICSELRGELSSVPRLS